MVVNYLITGITTIFLSTLHGFDEPFSCQGAGCWTSSSTLQSGQSVPNSSPDSTPSVLEVKQIKIEGNEVFPDDFTEFNQVKQKYLGKTVSVEQLKTIADEITNIYRAAGYITSRAIIPTQEVIDGTIRIKILEGQVEIKVKPWTNKFRGNSQENSGDNLEDNSEQKSHLRLHEGYIKSRVVLNQGKAFNINQLEDNLRLLKADPLIEDIKVNLKSKQESEADSQPGQEPESKDKKNQTILVVEVKEASLFDSDVSIDNYYPPSLGSERGGINLKYNNLTGLGDRFSASYYPSTTGGADVYDVTYQIPVNPMDGTIQLRVAPYWQDMTQAPLDELGVRGERDFYQINYRQPIIRTPLEEFALSVGFTHHDGQTFLFNDIGTPFGIGPDENGVSRTSVINFGQEYILRDVNGSWFVRSQFNLGTGWLDATINSNPIPDGRFFSWVGQVQRVQQLSEDHLLVVQTYLQLSPDTMLPMYQFVIGGVFSVRGYRQNARSADNGIRFSVEDQITLLRGNQGKLRLVPFFDLGAVWNSADNPNLLPRQQVLVGTGLGVIVDDPLGLKGLSLRLDYGIPLNDLDDRGNNVQDDGFYFQVKYRP
jgi:hemolysin activation/secretion protein